MEIRERLYQTEQVTLSRYAMLCKNTRGRMYPIAESPLRTEYMRDRDRIIHSKSFRRLKDKTQVFLNPQGSHYRTRLTHTMEVSQIARTISRALMLNDDLTEAIALGHDLGHTPFGHAGERSLARHVAFSHNVQSLRVVEKLENGKGLNLTWEVRDGILRHRKNDTPGTLEGMAVNFADRIAYINHDIDDALRAGILSQQDLPQHCMEVLGDRHSARINAMITSIVQASQDAPALTMGEDVQAATDELRAFMFERVYMHPDAKREERRVRTIIDMLFDYYLAHKEDLPAHYLAHLDEDGPEVCVADYISGMTDGYAVRVFEELFVPHNWTKL